MLVNMIRSVISNRQLCIKKQLRWKFATYRHEFDFFFFFFCHKLFQTWIRLFLPWNTKRGLSLQPVSHHSLWLHFSLFCWKHLHCKKKNIFMICNHIFLFCQISLDNLCSSDNIYYFEFLMIKSISSIVLTQFFHLN